jgi:signal transduction histidine kinase
MPTTPFESEAQFQFVTERSLAEHLKFLELDESSRASLQDILRLIQPHSTQLIERFYEHLFQFTQTSRFLNDPTLVTRLKTAQLEHLESMLTADWNDAYLARRLRVGDVHAQLGIDPHSFLGAYKLYLRDVFQLLAEQDGLQDKPFLPRVVNLIGAVLLDIGLTVEAYFSRGAASLRKALEMLWQANAELRLFAQLTSHDLKTPLATVANLCDEVLDEFGPQLPTGAAELITAARNRIFRMSDTIDELLETSISLQSQDNEQLVFLERPFQEALDRVRPIIEAKGIELQAMPLNVSVLGNHVKLREAIYNVLSNAAKFTLADSGGKIRAAIEVQPGLCLLTISDTGPGIPPEELQHIFIPFRRLRMHRDEPGSGLGLYFTKSLVEQMHGKVTAHSELGLGTRFVFQLLTHSPLEGSNAD